ncbi:chalcone isomerase family protein [Mesonia sp. K7]|uniref:chalcone isomerase family protein n=1 Tax=Mesonia sp. K7 TaxID=2218606 RepID=UPI000DA9FC61|nr:chalcone isomerase family protein [Mesonia sp. K7]PZD76896.1 chalcone isomerase [Mesonia sp. K7]
MKKLAMMIALIGMIPFSYGQTKVGDVTLPNSLTFGKHKMDLNGAGMREKFWIDLYAAGLYLTTKTSNADEVINSDQAMAVRLQIVSGMVTSEKMTDAVLEGLEKSTKGNIEPIRNELNKFLAFFEEEIKKGDVFDITYQPGRGTVAYKNGKEEGVIEGMEFKKALFGIWFCPKPADDDLKEDMLGK